MSSPPKPLKTRENIDAPINIIKTNELIFTVVMEASIIFLISSCLFKNEIISAPAAPTAADSVGVATPKKIEPNTDKIKIIGGSKSIKKFLII